MHAQDIPYGHCHCGCGCGEKTEPYPRTSRTIGWIKGQPRRYINGHQSRIPVQEYIVAPGTGCWIWQRYIGPKGYGLMRPYGSKRMHPAHRVYYERAKGPIPEGMQLDHLCHSSDSDCSGGNSCIHRRCVNPDHLEPVTNRENGLRGRRPKLTPEAVAEIRRRPKTYGSTLALADEFGVSASTISSVRNRTRGWTNA